MTDSQCLFLEKKSKKLSNIKAKRCLNCNRYYKFQKYKLVLFELDRKMFYQSNKNVKDSKIRFQGQKKQLLIKSVFISYDEDY